MGKKNKGNKNRGSLGDDFEDSYSYDSDDDSYQDYGRSNKKNKRSRNRGNDSYDDYGYDSYSNAGGYDNNDYDDSYDGYDDYEDDAQDEEQDDSSLSDGRPDESSDSGYSYTGTSSHSGYNDSSYSDSSSVSSFQQKKPSPLAGMHPAKAVPSFSNASGSSDFSSKNSFAGGGMGDSHVSSNQETAPVFKPVTPVVAPHATTVNNSHSKESPGQTNIGGEPLNSAQKNHEGDSLSATEENAEEDVREEKPTGGVLSRLFHRKTERKNTETEEKIGEENTTSPSDGKEEKTEQNADNTPENEDDEYIALRIEEIKNSLLKIDEDVNEYEEMLSAQDATDSDREEVENAIEKLQNEKKALKQELRELQKSNHGEFFRKMRGVAVYPFALLSKIPQFFRKKDVDEEEAADYDDTAYSAQKETNEEKSAHDDVSSDEDVNEELPARDWRRIAYRTTGVTIVVTVLLACGYVGYLFWMHGHASPEEDVVASTETETVEKKKAPGFFDRVKAKFNAKSDKLGQGEELVNDDSNSSSKAQLTSKSGGDVSVAAPSTTPKMAQMDLEKQDGLISDEDAVDSLLPTSLTSDVREDVSLRTLPADAKSDNKTELSSNLSLDSDSSAPVETAQSVGVVETSNAYTEDDLDDLIVSNTSLPDSVDDDLMTSSAPTVGSEATSEGDEDVPIGSQIGDVESIADNSSSSNDLAPPSSEDSEEDLTATAPIVSDNEPSLDDTLAMADNNANSTPSGAQWGSDDSSSGNSTASTRENSIGRATRANDLQSSQLVGSEVSPLASNNSPANNIVNDELDNSSDSLLPQTDRSATLGAEPSNYSLSSSDNSVSTASSLSTTASLPETSEEASPLTSLAASKLGSGVAEEARASLSLANEGLLEGEETSGTDLDLHLGDSSNAIMELTEESDLNELSGAGASLTNDYSSVADNLDSAAGRSSLSSVAGNDGTSLTNALAKFEEGVDDAVQGINDVTQGVRDRIDSFSQAVEEGQSRFSERGEAIADSINNSLTSLSNSLESSRNTIIEGSNDFIETVGEAYDSSVTSLKNTGNSLRANLQGLQSSLGLSENDSSENILSDAPASLDDSSSFDNSLSLIKEEENLANSLASESTDNSLSSVASLSRESSSSPLSLRGNGNAVTSNLLQEGVGSDASLAQAISGVDALADDQELLETPSSRENTSLSPSLAGGASSPRLGASDSPADIQETPQRTLATTTSRETFVGFDSGSNDGASQELLNPSTTSTGNSHVNNTGVSKPGTALETNLTNSGVSSSPFSFGRTGVRKRLPSSVMTTGVSGDVGADDVKIGSASTTSATTLVNQGTSNAGGQNTSLPISGGNSTVAIPAVSSNASQSSEEYRVYVTKEGDNLLTIAQNELGSSSRWGEIRRINNLRSGAAYFEAGTRLLLPISTSSGN